MMLRNAPLSLLSVCMLALLAGACDDDLTSPSTLDGPQLLAVQLQPQVLTPGTPHEAIALGHALDDASLSWQACALPWIPEESGIRCGAEDVPDLPAPFNTALPLGVGNPLAFDLPPLELTSCATDADCDGYTSCVDGTCPISLWLRVDDTREEGALPAILQVSTGAAVEHPDVTALETEIAGTSLPETLEAGAELVVTPTLTDPLGDGGQVVSYFTSGGRFDPWRTQEGAPSTLTAPEEPGDITLTVIVRDPGGGVGWRQHLLTVTEAP